MDVALFFKKHEICLVLVDRPLLGLTIGLGLVRSCPFFAKIKLDNSKVAGRIGSSGTTESLTLAFPHLDPIANLEQFFVVQVSLSLDSLELIDGRL